MKDRVRTGHVARSLGAALTLATAAAEALARVPAGAAAHARSEAARRDVGDARSQWFPSVFLNGAATKYELPMVVTPIHGFSPGDLPQFDDVLLQGSLTADWLLFDGGGRGARIAQQGSLYRAADADAEGGDARIVGQTINTYLRVLGQAATLAAHDRRLDALVHERGRVQQLADVGRAPEVDVRRAEATVAAAEAERVRLAASLDIAERALARLTGRNVEDTRAARLAEVALADTTRPSRESLLAQTEAAAPDIRAAEARVRAAEAAVRAGRSTRWPSLHAVGGWQSYGSDGSDWDTEWNAGVRLQLPLFTGGAISSRVGRAKATRDATRSELALARLSLEADLDDALAADDEARARTTSLALAVSKFEEVARIEQLRLEVESGTQTDWLDAESQLLVARAQLLEAQHAQIVARAEIARLTGTLDPDWVDHTLEAK